MVSLKFTGGLELSKALNALADELKPAVILEGLKAAGEPMRARMAQLAPREPGAPDLAENIGMSQVKKFEGVATHEDEVALAIGPTKGFFYGYFQEFGTVHHSAQPFMRPSFDSEHQKALAKIGQELWAVLKRNGSGV